METPKDSQQFSWLLPNIYTTFHEITGNLSWVTVEKSTNWQELFPLPDVDASETLFLNEQPMYGYGQRKVETLETITEERKQKWQRLSEDWYKDSKLIIYVKKDQLRKKFQEGLDEWKANGKKTALTADDWVDEWSLKNSKMNISQLKWLSITNKRIGAFLLETDNKRKTDFGLTDPPSATEQHLGFDTYIKEEHRAKLMPYLIENYTDTSTEQIGYLLYALAELKYTTLAKLVANKTSLHRGLTKTFGFIGTRQALSTAIQRLDSKEINAVDKLRVVEHGDRIVTFLQLNAAD